MDWNLKANSWDLAALEQEAIASIDAFDRPTRIEDDDTRRGDFSIDLKLGGIDKSSDQKSINKWKLQPGISEMQSSTSGSTKRARGASNGNQRVACLVDGCSSDLTTCRDYHRRHKVCELHSKTPQVTICGQKQRFCQQCSRFHSLEEFDEGKRSCRKRLDGHNRRRRKPQPGPLSRSASFLSNFQGTQLLSFSGAHVYASTSTANPTWPGLINPASETRPYDLHHQQMPLVTDKQNQFLGSSSSNYKGEKQFPFLQSSSSNQTSPVREAAYPQSIGARSSRHDMFCERLTAQVRESDCALSLLSSTSQMQMQSSGNHMVHANPVSLATVVHDHSLDSILVSNGRGADVHCQVRSGVSSGSTAPQPLPFSWE